jgi:hypothetical protein
LQVWTQSAYSSTQQMLERNRSSTIKGIVHACRLWLCRLSRRQHRSHHPLRLHLLSACYRGPLPASSNKMKCCGCV